MKFKKNLNKSNLSDKSNQFNNIKGGDPNNIENLKNQYNKLFTKNQLIIKCNKDIDEIRRFINNIQENINNIINQFNISFSPDFIISLNLLDNDNELTVNKNNTVLYSFLHINIESLSNYVNTIKLHLQNIISNSNQSNNVDNLNTQFNYIRINLKNISKIFEKGYLKVENISINDEILSNLNQQNIFYTNVQGKSGLVLLLNFILFILYTIFNNKDKKLFDDL